MHRWSLAGLILVVVLLLSACGSDTETTTVVERTVVEESPSSGSGWDADVSRSDRSSSRSDAAGGDGARTVTVPDVVGENHQYAQDTMQDAGLYNLAEEDATGQGRVLLWDRNWVVVEQDPPAGTNVAPDTRITLRSKKIGE